MTIISAWGKHMTLNLAGCNPRSIRCAKHIASYSFALVEKINMISYGKPILKHFGTDEKMGYTLVQLIETSNITGHFCESTNDAYIDIFSCKDFDKKLVKNITKAYFAPTKIYTRTILRNAPNLELKLK
jgi:hypothetical protein